MRLFGAISWWLSLTSVAAFGQLTIVQPVVAQFDGGPSVASGFAFGSGESIFLSFDIAGFKPEGDEDLKLNLSWQCQAFDAAGIALTAPQKGDVKVDLAAEDKKWRPRVRVELELPQALPAGAAEIRLAAVDHVGAGKAALVVPFRTRGLNLTGIDKLQPLRFRFLRSEESNEPLTVPAYRQGDMVWARFEIAGYRLGEGNAFQVGYGLEVFRANGESLFKQDEAANESGKPVYPRRYLAGVLSLQLTKDLAPGEYTILLRIRDGIGGEQSESKHLFRVE
ncbi:MAG: hypothetical protein ACKV2U_20420 [Bryobacteraceae bacterium]